MLTNVPLYSEWAASPPVMFSALSLAPFKTARSSNRFRREMGLQLRIETRSPTTVTSSGSWTKYFLWTLYSCFRDRAVSACALAEPWGPAGERERKKADLEGDVVCQLVLDGDGCGVSHLAGGGDDAGHDEALGEEVGRACRAGSRGGVIWGRGRRGEGAAGAGKGQRSLGPPEGRREGSECFRHWSTKAEGVNPSCARLARRLSASDHQQPDSALFSASALAPTLHLLRTPARRQQSTSQSSPELAEEIRRSPRLGIIMRRAVSTTPRLARSLATAAKPQHSFPALPLKYTTLPNGVRVATDPTPGHFVAAGVYVDGGSRYEGERTRGAGHMVDRLGFKVSRPWGSGRTLPMGRGDASKGSRGADLGLRSVGRAPRTGRRIK